MEEIEVNMNLISSAEPSSFPEESEVQLPIKQNKVILKKRALHSMPKKRQRIIGKKALSNRKQKWFIEPTSYLKSKDDGMQRLPKITTKRRKYTKSKKEDLDINKNVLDDSTQKLIAGQNINGTSHLLPAVDLLEKYNFKYEVKPESNTHENFFLQDKYMNAFSKYYPEYVCIDFLCEIPQLELNLCLFISVDGNGFCEIISIGLIKSFDSGLLWLSEVFKKYNPNWRKIKIITCDKKASTLEVIKIAFPEKPVFISFFHSMKALKQELSNLDPDVSEQEINEVIHIFEDMVYSTDDGDYSELLKQFKLMPPSIVTYFRKTWHQKKDSWALGHQLNSRIFQKSFNTYLLYIRKEIRPIVNTKDSIESVFEHLCFSLERMRKEKFQKFTSAFSLAIVFTKQIPHHKYAKFLTKFASELVIEQFSNSRKVKNVRKLSCGKFICASEDVVTTNACSCNFFQLFSLPCSHIFAVRKHLSLSLFAETLSSYRWIATNYQSTYMDLHNSFILENKKYSTKNDDESKRFKKYFKVCAELWPLLSQCSENISLDRMQIFRSLLNVLRNGIKVNIKASEIQNNTSCNNSVPLEDVSTDYWKEMYGVSLKDILDSDNDFPSVCSEFSKELL